jgi:hypothetical protein
LDDELEEGKIGGKKTLWKNESKRIVKRREEEYETRKNIL